MARSTDRTGKRRGRSTKAPPPSATPSADAAPARRRSLLDAAGDSAAPALAWLPEFPDRVARWALLVAMAAYSLWIMPGVSADKDAGEFTLALATWGLPHPTGYPIYTIAGSAFVNAVVAVLSLSWDRASALFSLAGSLVAVWLAMVACGDCCRLARVPAGRRWPFLGLLAGVFALNPAFTYETTLPEVYSWHLAWVALACVVFGRLVAALRLGPATPRRLMRLAACWGLVSGVGMSHHATALFVILPCSAVIVWLLWRRRALRVSLLAIGLAASVLPALSYLYVAWRAWHPTDISTWYRLQPSWLSVWEHMTGAQYRGYLGRFDPNPVQWRLLREALFPLLGVLLPAGVIVAAMRVRGVVRGVLLGLVGALVCLTVYTFSYGVHDPASYFLAPVLVGLIVTPILWARLTRGLRTTGLRLVPVSIIVLALAFGAYHWHRLNTARQAGLVAFDSVVRGMWDSIPDIEAFVFWPDDMVFRLHCYQVLEGSKPQLRVYSTNSLFVPFVREQMMRDEGIDPWMGMHDREFLDTMGASRVIGDATDPIVRAQAAVHEAVNRQSPLPVILFDPANMSVRLLQKPE